MTSPAFTSSPSFFTHFEIVPDVIVGDSAGRPTTLCGGSEDRQRKTGAAPACNRTRAADTATTRNIGQTMVNTEGTTGVPLCVCLCACVLECVSVCCECVCARVCV